MRTIVDLPEEQIKALDTYRKRHGISRAEAVRRAVAAFFPAEPHKKIDRFRDRSNVANRNLFYPRATPDEPWHVQCAGGTFREGRIGHIHGMVLGDPHATEGGVS
jgi:hypothetical protein